ncbi:unnamed protein product, partial [Protopolystoma xenopodis]
MLFRKAQTLLDLIGLGVEEGTTGLALATRADYELVLHLRESSIIVYHCLHPNCLVKSTSFSHVLDHVSRCHLASTNCIAHTRDFSCSWPLAQQPIKTDPSTEPYLASNNKNRTSPSLERLPCLSCPHCSFGTSRLEAFAEHIASCNVVRGVSNSLSVTCTLYRCSECKFLATSRNMLIEHLSDFHPQLGETSGIHSEEFVVPISEENLPSSHSTIHHQCSGPVDSHQSQSFNVTQNGPINFSTVFPSSVLNSLASTPEVRDSGFPLSLFSGPVNKRSPPSTVGKRRVDALASGATYEESSLAAETRQLLATAAAGTAAVSAALDAARAEERSAVSPNGSGGSSRADGLEADGLLRPAMHSLPPGIKVKEYVHLYFNEMAFTAAYKRTSRTATGRALRNAELPGILVQLRRFATYKVPILGRANQRRVAGCPECHKAFNHGFSDLKKHLLVSHMGLRRDVARFAINFTHTPRNMPNTVTVTAGSPDVHSSPSRPEDSSPGSPTRQESGDPALGTPPDSGLKDKKNSHELHLSDDSDDDDEREGGNQAHDKLEVGSGRLATASQQQQSQLPVATSVVGVYPGSAPIHRVVPGTGVSDHGEDARTFDEAAANAPRGRGGIIPLDEAGVPIQVAVLAALASSPPGKEIFLPQPGRQRIQL